MEMLLQEFPSLAEPLLHERDRYITYKIRNFSIHNYSQWVLLTRSALILSSDRRRLNRPLLYTLDTSNRAALFKQFAAVQREPSREVLVAVVGLGHLDGGTAHTHQELAGSEWFGRHPQSVRCRAGPMGRLRWYYP